MRFLMLLLCFCMFITTRAQDLGSEAESKNTKWELAWEDNFDTDGLPDKNIWSYEVGHIRNNEAQYYTERRIENARVENGNLIIKARKDNFEGNEITSASINTNSKRNILYGRVEVKAKLPTGRGTWPAIWMLGTSIKNGTGWPACGEIDIMENVGFEPNVIHANIHTKSYNHVLGTNKGNSTVIQKPYEDFHVYALEWFEDHMDFYIDNTLYFSFKNENTGNDTWPFDKPHYLLINLAIGGGWGGQKGIDESIFPQIYYIDYVKVYKQK
ncbi:glycoside hydrolase family 16 protein [Maribellus comscasis]|nr:glycoside hydrolase family 16 protein [Maribellus comscasis]